MNKTLFKLSKYIKLFLRKLQEDHVTAYSAMSAYFLLLSFLPFLMLLLMLAKYLPFRENDVFALLNSFRLIQENTFLQTILQGIFYQDNKTFFGITLFVLLWAASKSIWGFMKGLNSVYHVKEKRGGLLLRFLAVFYTIAFLFIITLVLILLVFGNTLYRCLLNSYPILSSVADILFGIRSIFFLFLLTGFFLLLYMHIPTRKAPLRSQMIGALFASVGWNVYSFFFSIYVNYFSDYSKLYGGLGTVLVFFLWLYMLMYILFLGAEVNYFFMLRPGSTG